MKLWVLAATAWSLAAVAQAAPVRCDALSLEPGQHCGQAPTGVVVSDDPAVALRFAAVMAEGEARFRAHFGREPTPYGVLLGETLAPIGPGGVLGEDTGPLQAALRQAGAQHVLPWMTAAQRQQLNDDMVRRTSELALRAQGLDGAQLAAGIEKALADARAARRPGGVEDSAVAHEFGHLWFMRAFFSGAGAPTGAALHYGGPAPDWFDETAAILMEDEALSEARRAEFRAAYRGPERATLIRPLTALFSAPHPMARPPGPPAMRMSTQDGRPMELPPGFQLPKEGDPGVRIIRPGDPGAPQGPNLARLSDGPLRAGSGGVAAAKVFYAQNRVLIDFLKARSGDPTIFGKMAQALAAGSTLDQWLAQEGAKHRLPSTVEALDAEWSAWVERIYAA